MHREKFHRELACSTVDEKRQFGYNITERYIVDYGMSTRSVSFRQFILGLLAQQPMSGYDIKRAQKSLTWLVGNPSFGSLYPTLHCLLREGRVTMEVREGHERPSRKVYSLTEAGRRELREWADRPHPSNGSLKEFVMHLNLAGSLSHEALFAHLRQRHEQVTAQRAMLARTVNAIDEDADPGQRLVASFALALAIAELAWLESALNEHCQ
jgi:PadR family transcriptional regulator, regulatory protein AphA